MRKQFQWSEKKKKKVIGLIQYVSIIAGARTPLNFTRLSRYTAMMTNNWKMNFPLPLPQWSPSRHQQQFQCSPPSTQPFHHSIPVIDKVAWIYTLESPKERKIFPSIFPGASAAEGKNWSGLCVCVCLWPVCVSINQIVAQSLTLSHSLLFFAHPCHYKLRLWLHEAGTPTYHTNLLSNIQMFILSNIQTFVSPKPNLYKHL